MRLGRGPFDPQDQRARLLLALDELVGAAFGSRLQMLGGGAIGGDQLIRGVGGQVVADDFGAHTSLDCLSAAPTKPANKGCGSKGRLLSSGWNCTPMNHG